MLIIAAIPKCCLTTYPEPHAETPASPSVTKCPGTVSDRKWLGSGRARRKGAGLARVRKHPGSRLKGAQGPDVEEEQVRWGSCSGFGDQPRTCGNLQDPPRGRQGLGPGLRRLRRDSIPIDRGRGGAAGRSRPWPDPGGREERPPVAGSPAVPAPWDLVGPAVS